MDIIMDTCSREGPFQIFNRFPDLFFIISIQFIWRGNHLILSKTNNYYVQITT